jgi:trehalose 6-phosphate phosphatase
MEDTSSVIWDRPLALFLDVDGTLLDIRRRPADVAAPPGLRELLGAACDALGGALALVSGRPIADLDRIFAPLRLPAAGQHGCELRPERDGACRRMPARRLAPALRRAVLDVAAIHPGVEIEDKGLTLAVHYRGAPAAASTLTEALARLAGEAGHPVSLGRGKMMLELRDARFTKASAVEAFLDRAPFAGRLPVFIGDDVTDEDGFEAVERHGGIAMPVGRMLSRDGRERRATFAGPADVREWLATLVPSDVSQAS